MHCGIYKIRGKVRNYAWGGYSFIPAFIGESGPQKAPSAEYWLGAHPNDPATVCLGDGQSRKLTDFQAESGEPPLPFLMKVLDVRGMLSIQVHPSRELAQIGYARDTEAGIAPDAPERTYKDKNHKPELMFALSDFWMLHGMRSESDLRSVFKSRPSCQPLLDILENKGLPGLVDAAVSKEDPVIGKVTADLINEVKAGSDKEDKATPDFWILRWLDDNPGVERGLLMILLMNLVNLKPGQAVYQPDGLIHAYLEGRNIEIMANSDNVLRAGLTVKHIDAAELLKISRLDATDPSEFIVNASRDANGIRNFDTPFKDFHLSEIEVPPQASCQLPPDRSRIILAGSGEAIEVSAEGTSTSLVPGEACYATRNTEIRINNTSQRTAQMFIGS